MVLPTRFQFILFLPLLAASSLGGVDFALEVAPVLEHKCLSCHNPNILKGDFSMATREDILEAGDDLLIPGNAEESMLHWITLPFDDEPPEMPEEGDPLTEAEAALLAQWINDGAEWPVGFVLKEPSKSDKSWWAYQPVAEPQLDSIDAYLEVELVAKNLTMNPEADRRTLIRRATYDLIGLPPTPEEVEAFVKSEDPLAYEKLIDRLLASPHYGERWGRHWLDVVRFGESVGFERNTIIEDLWPFRDYVIRSINEDKPFDIFIQEHLAGDVLGRGDPDIEIGSAFLVAGPYDNVGNQDAVQVAQIRANTLDEMINATGEAFLGMTLSCARCHDHKFDPILQADYYSFYATFSGVRHGSVTWASKEEKQARAAEIKPLNQRIQSLETDIETLEAEVLERSKANLAQSEALWTRPSTDRTGTEEVFEPVTAKFVRLVCETQDVSIGGKTGFRIDEFEVWSSGPDPKNVALQTNGGIARGEARKIEDFPEAYSAQIVNDGKIGDRFIAASDTLTIELAKVESVDRVNFSSARGEQAPDLFTFAFIADYRIEVSLDGESWTEVANGNDRKPVPPKPGNPARPEVFSETTHLEYRLQRLGMTSDEQATMDEWKAELASLRRQIREVPDLPTAFLGTRVDKDAEGPFHVFIGGSPQRPGARVVPVSLSTLSEALPGYELPANTAEEERRLQLARWITDPANPLTPRVLANRLWHYHFGTGIVDTPNDFGYMGGRPTHPELLDFLASKLLENDWQLKPMHRLIMTSQAYRQSSDWNESGASVDGDSRLLWRFPPRRLSAEEIRDSILAVSGKLDTQMGGPGFRLYQYMQDNVSTYVPLDEHGPETYRRSIYHHNARASVVDLMTDFDMADCTLSAPRRAQTTTPLQALTMMNHQFTLDMADSLAARVERSGNPNSREQVKAVFQCAYQRDPTGAEFDQSLAVAKKYGIRALCRAILNSSEFIYLD
jgi:hypothetical protein